MEAIILVRNRNQITLPKPLIKELGWKEEQHIYLTQGNEGLLLHDANSNADKSRRIYLRKRNQLTLPLVICSRLGIAESDSLLIVKGDGFIEIIPQKYLMPTNTNLSQIKRSNLDGDLPQTWRKWHEERRRPEINREK